VSDKVLSIEPNMIHANITKGEALFSLGRYDEAIAVFDKILAIYPDEIDVLNGKGDVLLNLGKYKEAITIYDKVQSLAVGDNDALVHAEDGKKLAIEALSREDEKKQMSSELIDNITTTINKNNNTL
jgi:tetratricopeptide (TPR) repeat protein